MKKTTRAFTLIELLVVIAIIAILAAILFPVFAQAKLSAKKAVYVSNEKQVSLAMIMYTNDYDDMFPQGETGDSYGAGHPHVTWSTMIYPYVKNGDQNIDPQSGMPVCTAKGGLYLDPAGPVINQTVVGDEGYYMGPNDLICPANYQGGEPWFGDQEIVPMTTTSIPTPADTMLLSEKGANPVGPWSFPWTNDNQLYYMSHIATVPGDPSTVFADGNNTMSPGTPLYDPTIDTDCNNTNEAPYYACASTPRYRYNGNTVMAFSDGHVHSIVRGGLKWFKNVYIQRGGIPTDTWTYGYYFTEPN